MHVDIGATLRNLQLTELWTVCHINIKITIRGRELFHCKAGLTMIHIYRQYVALRCEIFTLKVKSCSDKILVRAIMRNYSHIRHLIYCAPVKAIFSIHEVI